MKKAKNVSLCGGGGEFLNGSPKTSQLKSLRVEAGGQAGFLNGLCASGCILKSCNNERSSIINPSPLHRFISSTKAFGFTMAEILLSLTIIGVVAAITLPSLTGNINERTWNTQRKALYARMSQAIALMPALNNYGSTLDNHAETFITNGLSKVLKINNICGYGTDGSTLYDCGFASQYVDGAGTKTNLPKEIKSLNAGIINYTSPVSIKNTKAAAFETANGESILTFYNPNCTAENVMIAGESSSGIPGHYVKQQVCVNFVYDLNGKKGPNTVGKDIGAITVVYSSDSKVVMPMYPRGFSGAKSLTEASQACNDLDEGQYRLPNIEELLSIYYNKNLYGGTTLADPNVLYWSGSAYDATHNYGFGAIWGLKYQLPKDGSNGYTCVQR